MTTLWKTHLIGSMLILTSAGQISASETELRDSIPATWTYESEYISTLPSDDEWWAGFEDPILTDLIRKGEQSSFDLSMALHRIEMARQNWNLARSAYYPTVGVQAGWNRARSAGAISSPAGISITSDYFSLGLNFSWEIDIFGKVRAQSAQSKAAYKASKAEYHAAMVTLGSNIATAYFNYRLAQERIEVAKAQISSQQEISKKVQTRFETGLVSKLDVAQALTVLYSTQSSLPSLENMRTSALNSLAMLLGCYPEEIAPMLEKPQELPIAFRMVKLGVPRELLRRRPDIRAAEYELAEYAAAVGVAKKDFLPTLALTGSVGTQAHRLDKLFTNDSFTYSVAPQLSWTIFEGMARKYRVASAKEQMLSGIDNYNMTVMNAVIETEDAISNYESLLKQITLQRKVCAESRELFTLAVDRYKQGLAAFTDVMNAQITVLDNEMSLVEERASALTALVKLYAAVAGAPTE